MSNESRELQRLIEILSRDSKQQIDWVFRNNSTPAHVVPHEFEKLWSSILSSDWSALSYRQSTRGITRENAVKLLARSDFTDRIFLDKLLKIQNLNATTYIASFAGRDVELVIVQPSDSVAWGEPVPEYIAAAIVRMALLLPSLVKCGGVPQLTQMTVFPVNIDKQQPIDGIWSPLHINTGVSAADFGIMIWRRQELLKVAIHELVHLYLADFGDSYFAAREHNMQFELRATPFRSREPRWNEGLTEAIATLAHIACVAKLADLNEIHCRTLYDIECAHVDTMCNSIFGTGFIRESSSVFSYFVIKSLLIDKHADILSDFLHGSLDYGAFQKRISLAIANRSFESKTAVSSAPTLRMSAIGL
jgi:hypothetical protein